MLSIKEIEAKSILNKSKIFDYCLNPYTGCQIGCKYCYARLFMRRYSGHKEAWGNFVDAKINAPLLLRKQIGKVKPGTIWISSVCDPYQPLEAKYKITRSCLKELVTSQFPLNIQTKSPLVLRDADLFQKMKTIEVGFTITTDDEQMTRLFEPHAAPVADRIKALKEIRLKGIRTFVFIGPILPGSPERLVERLEGKVDKVLVDRMNYMGTIKRLYKKENLEQATRSAFFQEYKERYANELVKRNMKFELLF